MQGVQVDYAPVISAFGSLKQEDYYKFDAYPGEYPISQEYIARPYFKKPK